MRLFPRLRGFLRRDEGAILTTEKVLWATLLVIGLIAAIVVVRFAVTKLYLSVAESVANREGYRFGIDPRSLGAGMLTTGTFFTDNAPFPGTDSGGVQMSDDAPGEFGGGKVQPPSNSGEIGGNNNSENP